MSLSAIAGMLSAARDIHAARARQSEHVHQLRLRTTERLVSSLLLLCALSFGVVAPAHAHQIAVDPVILYHFSNLQDCNCAPGPWETSLSAAWADSEAAAATVPGQTAIGSPSPTPNVASYNGVASSWNFSVQECSGGNCNTYNNIGTITIGITCPSPTNFAASQQNSGTYPTYTAQCLITIPDAQAPPNYCKTCTGNPIYPASGQKVQTETDYSGAPGMSFVRTYSSNNGYFSSVLTHTFLNNSSSGVPSGCLQAAWTYQSASGTYCFPYANSYPNLAAQYEVQTPEGRSLQFTGPNNAVTQAADINDRVTMLTVNGATEWQVHREDDTVELYNASGELIQKTLRGGRVLTYTYSTSSTPSSVAPFPGLLLTQADPFGHTLSWQYNSAGEVSQMTDPAGGIYAYGYDGIGNLTTVTYPDNSVRTYWYNESANTSGANLPNTLTGITDESSTRYATFQYKPPAAGSYPPFALNTQHAGGVESYSITYNGGAYYGGGITTATVTDPLGTQRTYQYANNLSYNDDTSQTQPAASGSGTVTQSESYDANGNPNSVTDYQGNVTKRVFDQTRNLETSRTEAYGTSIVRTITTAWDANWRQPDLISVYNNGTGTGTPIKTTAFTYDSMGNVLTKTVTDMTVTPNVTRTWTYTYDSYGRMLTAKGPRTDVNSTTTYTYYTCTTGSQCGQLDTVTDPVGNVTTYNTYNAHGQPLTITDPNGVLTTLTYDARMRLTSRQVGSETTSFSYYPTGLLKKVTLPDSSYVQYTYDGAHRLTQISDGAGNSIQYTLDNMGNRTAENRYDPSNVLHYTHSGVINTLNQLYQDVNAAGTAAVTTTFGYDNNGNQTSIAAPMSRNTSNAYDELNRLKQITDPVNGITKFSYDVEDDLLSVIDPRTLTTSYQYTGFGDVTQLTSPDTGVTQYTYDSAGNPATSTDARGASANYAAYDALNRPTSVAYKKGGVTDQTITYTYDAGTYGKGRLTGASDASHSMSWMYDALGRVTNKSQTVGGITKSVGYAYTNGNLTTLTTPYGATIAYGYNSNHQVTSISVNGTTLLSSVTYEPFGAVNGWTWGNGTTATRAYDTDQKISQISSAGVKGYSYDNAFRITGLTDTSLGQSNWTYGYDLLDRITSGGNGTITRGWTYDANGNRLTETGTNASTYTISATNNQVSSITGSLTRSYSYDAAGNVTAWTGVTAGYNDRGRMSTITNSGVGETSNYTYNALGQMIDDNSASFGTVLIWYDEAGHLLSEYNGVGGMLQETVWFGDIPVATLRPNGSTVSIYYVHTNHLNTPLQVTRPSDGVQMWRWPSDPFGTLGQNTNPQGAGTFLYRLRFAGQALESPAGLNPNGFRDYDPFIGRYLESDPLGLFGGSYSTYAYAAGNPIGLSDPTGQEVTMTCRPLSPAVSLGFTEPQHCSVFVWHWVKDGCGQRRKVITAQYSLPYGGTRPSATNPNNETFSADTTAFNSPGIGEYNYDISVPTGMTQAQFDANVTAAGANYVQGPYQLGGPNSNSAAATIIYQGGNGNVAIPNVPGAVGEFYYIAPPWMR